MSIKDKIKSFLSKFFLEERYCVVEVLAYTTLALAVGYLLNL